MKTTKVKYGAEVESTVIQKHMAKQKKICAEAL